ncbi:Bacillibactin exporter [Paenibacillus allorhizoplanae]|uniref:Bacillibactin exporter n=1 Tax=Paenibacillus allorhizoplanae TaxID=2905648 RepID=A0ABM9CS66_9BACL|nr:MFS transporter [Paenibacillus allorhizoplanae]CAH1222912.1 Bacillibactin exporter [Paenibacillus allorhizoplanae]
MKENKWGLISIASIPLIMTLGNSMLIPVLPAIRNKLQITSFQVSLLITVYSAVAIILIPIAGYLSDRFGRKIIIVPSLLITGIGGLISGLGAWWLEHPYVVIMLGRALQGVGAAGAFPIVLPLVGDIYKSESEVSKSLGIVETANTLGKVLSPIVGSALAFIVWFLPFLTIPVLCILSTGLVAFLVKAPPKKNETAIRVTFRDFIQNLKQIFVNNGRWLSAVFAIGCICMFVIFGTLFYLSDTLEDKYHIKGIWKGCVIAIPSAALCLASFFTGKRIGENKNLMKWITFGGVAIVSASLVVSGMVQSLYWLIALISLAGIGIGVTLPCLDSLITEGIDKAERGTITSIYSSMRFIGVATGPPLASVLVKFSPQLMFYSISGTCVVAVLLALFAIKPSQDELTAK